ncbi:MULTISPECIES: acyl-CoA dehydrogenase family protein [Kocuria]|uniref:acyl-CoA dehydrogenase family protein n=1 Tax=Kocuria TaxID=57493 RepID=UPI0013F15640|nr:MULTISPECIES: acyl-CoA dehydrogenase family protein [Kocuria]MDT0120962.1 acyl-CoA dehydrogenase family protein [Kocuria sp. PD6]
MSTTTLTDDPWSGFLDHLRDRTSATSRSRAEGFSTELWDATAASGLFSTLAAEGIGSSGMRAAIGRIRELGRTSPDRGLTFSAVTQLASTIYCLRAFSDKELQERYLPAAETGNAIGGHAITEAEAGSDVMSMTTTASLRDGHYVLNGTKRFITNAPIASTLVVYAKTVEDGVDKGLSAFLIETGWPGVDTSQPMPTAGLSTSPIGEVSLQGVQVPVRNRIGHTGAGLLILDQVMKREILLAFAGNIGEMEQLVSRSVRYVNDRKQFGTSIGSNQLVADRIVETQMAIELGGALLESIAERLDGFEDVTIPIAAAKVFISEANVDSAINAIRVHGGNGYLATSPLPTFLLDAIPGAIYSGSNDLLRTKIATMLGVTS